MIGIVSRVWEGGAREGRYDSGDVHAGAGRDMLTDNLAAASKYIFNLG